MPKINKKSENVNKREFFKKLFSTWKFNPKAIFYATFRIFGWYLLQKLNFFRIHVIWSPKWFPWPGVHQGQIFWPILWPMVSTIIGQKNLGVLLRLPRCHFSAAPNFHTVSVKVAHWWRKKPRLAYFVDVCPCINVPCIVFWNIANRKLDSNFPKSG